MSSEARLPPGQIDCPGGCGGTVYHRALICPRCGYRAPINAYHSLFQSLSVASSILLGFTITGLVTLAIESANVGTALLPWQQKIVYAVSSIWTFSTVLLFAVLLLAEVNRHHESSESPMQLSYSTEHRLRKRCDRLLSGFVIAAFLMFAGMIVLAFYFSLVNGILGIVAIFVCVALVIFRMR